MRAPDRTENELVSSMGLLALLKEDYRTHRRDWGLPGFRAVAVYRLGAWARGLKSPVFRSLCVFLHRRAFKFIRNFYGIEIESTATIGRRFHIGHQGGILIHAYATIGDDCLVRQGVTLGVGGLNRPDDFAGSGPVLGNNVDIGVGAVIVGKVRIGDRVNIGPNAVVIMDVPSNSTVLAPPARSMTRPAADAAGGS